MFWSQVVLYSRSAANGSEKTTGLIWSTRATLEELNKTSDPTDGMERIINVLHRNQNKTQSVLSYTHTHTHTRQMCFTHRHCDHGVVGFPFHLLIEAKLSGRFPRLNIADDQHAGLQTDRQN